MDLRSYLMDCILEDKNIIEELLLIDNKVQYTNLTYETLINMLKKINDYDILDGNFNYVAITDGEFDTVFKVLINIPSLSTLYVNRSFLGINKYLIKLVNTFYECEKVKLDDSTNYHKYVNSTDKIILSGFDTFVDEIAKEFVHKEFAIL